MKNNIKKPFRRNLKMYRNYVCPFCFNQINKCICKIYPPYTLIQIDKNMQEIVRELNKKGYKTKYSCESHYGYTYNIYISFLKKYIFKELPDGFVMPNDYTIEHIIKNSKKEKNFNQEKEKYLDILKKWVNTL